MVKPGQDKVLTIVIFPNGGRFLFFHLFGVLRCFQHCTGYIMTDS